jgi:hypothetical protein
MTYRAKVFALTLAIILATVPSAAGQRGSKTSLPLVWVLSSGGTISGKGAEY